MTRLRRRIAPLGLLLAAVAASAATPLDTRGDAALVAFGARLFTAASLSRDGTVSCQSCHDPAHAFADPRPVSIGVGARAGTRNAPSLIGIAHDDGFFWDGRRASLRDAVLDPFTNPAELGLGSLDELEQRIARDDALRQALRRAFPNGGASIAEQARQALTAYVTSLDEHRGAPHTAAANAPDAAQVERGRRLFFASAGCSECHASGGTPERFSDGKYHHSSVEQRVKGEQLAALVRDIAARRVGADTLGHEILTRSDWASLGRYCVSLDPRDIGTFRTPSLRNVAHTAPYMHDGSVATLAEAVDREIYYRSFSTGRPVDLSTAERAALVAFLESLDR